MYLLHDPTAGPAKRIEAYKVLLAAQKAGKFKAVGVSNFSEVHLAQLADAGLPPPEVNQIELHPWCQQKPIVEYCNKHGIVVEAYCPLVRGKTLGDETLVGVAKEVGKEPAQVLVRWSLQKGFVPLPKSDTPARIKSNAEVFDFELSDEQMARLDGLDQGAKGACSWNPVDRE